MPASTRRSRTRSSRRTQRHASRDCAAHWRCWLLSRCWPWPSPAGSRETAGHDADGSRRGHPARWRAAHLRVSRPGAPPPATCRPARPDGRPRPAPVLRAGRRRPPRRHRRPVRRPVPAAPAGAGRRRGPVPPAARRAARALRRATTAYTSGVVQRMTCGAGRAPVMTSRSACVMRPAHAAGSGRSALIVRCGPKTCSSEANAKSTASASWMKPVAPLTLLTSEPRPANRLLEGDRRWQRSARRRHVHRSGIHEPTRSGARRT